MHQLIYVKRNINKRDRGGGAEVTAPVATEGSPSEQTKHQLTFMCSWFLQPLRGVKWFGQRKVLLSSTTLPAAMQLSLA